MPKLCQYVLFLFLLSIPVFCQTPQPIIKINTGGAPITDTYNWTNDKYYTGGGFYKSTNLLPPNTSAIYQDVRYGPIFNYRIPLPNGKYTVILKFIEVIDTATDRKFDVSINGTKYITDYNILSDVGFNVPVDKSFTITTENISGLNIEFNATVRTAIIAGIEINQVPMDMTCVIRYKSCIYQLTTQQTSFPIPDPNVNIASFMVFRNGVLLNLSLDYYFATLNNIIITKLLAIGDVITITYLY